MKIPISAIMAILLCVCTICYITYDIRNSEISLNEYMAIQEWSCRDPELKPFLVKYLDDNKIVNYEWWRICDERKRIRSNKIRQSLINQ